MRSLVFGLGVIAAANAYAVEPEVYNPGVAAQAYYQINFGAAEQPATTKLGFAVEHEALAAYDRPAMFRSEWSSNAAPSFALNGVDVINTYKVLRQGEGAAGGAAATAGASAGVSTAVVIATVIVGGVVAGAAVSDDDDTVAPPPGTGGTGGS